jgi:diguanylate cyclase (GGDEF)-like protein
MLPMKMSPRLHFLPWLVLLTTLGITWLVWDHEHQQSRQQLRTQFDFALRETVSRIDQRATAYEQMLRGVQGLFSTTDMKNREAVRDYVHTLQLDANFSGIQTVGVMEHVLADQKEKHVAAMRRHGFPDYAIHPEGVRDFYTPIIQREPYVGRNKAPLGQDIWLDPTRRLALEMARDSGQAALTGKVQLVIDTDAAVNPSFIMYLPIFERGRPRDTVAERRTHLAGWVYATFHMNEFMASLYGQQAPELTLEIYDDANPSAAALMYRSDSATRTQPSAAGDSLTAKEYLVVAGHTWTLILSARDEFHDRYGRGAESIIAVTGIGLSILLSLLVWFMINGRAHALQLAEGMTEELRHMAQHDSLTGLPNRTLFSDRVQQTLAYAKRHSGHFAMIFLDLDNFKPVNDQYGHAIGDQLLKEVGRRLQDAIRASDTVGRIGGDEFVILMSELSGSEIALGLAEKIRQTIRQSFSLNGHELSISCSLGVAVYPEDGRDEITLTKSADEAMYRAKEDGRDKVCMAI